MTHTKGKLIIRITKPLASNWGNKSVHILTDYGSSTQTFCQLSGELHKMEANANRLIKCWNSHDKLIEAVKGGLSLLEQDLQYRKSKNLTIGLVFLETQIEDYKKLLKELS